MSTQYTPTVTGFTTFIRNVMGITTAQLPDDSTVITMAFDVAMEIVNTAINCVSPLIYQLAVYNLAGSNLLNYAQDPDGAPVFKDDMTFFTYMRSKWNMLDFIPGVIQSSGDEGTNQSYVVQEAAKNFTLANLQQLKDPYGRQYLSFAQDYGPSIWGLTP
jgi:hypothetical protein